MTGIPDAGLLTGRAKERALLARAVTRLTAGQGGSVLLEGEPGIGKSTLVDSVLADAAQLDVDVLYGECDELGRRLLPLSPMLTALGIVPDSADPRRAQAAKALSKPAGAGRSGRVSVVHGVDATAASIEILSALVDRMCAVRPVILAVDDLHSADEASLRFWLELDRAVAQLPLLLIGVRRPNPYRGELEELRGRIAGSPHGSVISLDPLSREEAMRLAADLVGARPGSRFAQRLESAAGNPLYVREVVHAALRSGLLSVTPDVAELEDGPEPGPGGRTAVALSAAIVDHLDFLSPDCREVLRVAAIQGVEFTVADASRLTGRSLELVSSLLDEALNAGVVGQVGQRVRFRHGLIRQALFDETPHPVRLAIYKDIALHLICSGQAVQSVAEAVLRALDVADGWELDWLAANARELAYRDLEAAADLLEHAVGENAVGEARRAEFEDILMLVYANLARYELVERLARRTRAESADPERLGHATHQLVRVLGFQAGRIDEAMAAAADGMNDQRIPAVWRARLRIRLASSLQVLGRDGAEAEAEAALAEAELLDDHVAQSVSLHILALQAARYGRMAESIGLFDRALALTEDDIELTDARMTIFLNKASFSDTFGLREEAQKSLRLGRAEAERIGSPRLACFHVMAGTIAGNYGRWDDALAEYGQLGDETIYADLNDIFHARSALIAIHRDDNQAIRRHLAAVQHCGTTVESPPNTLIFTIAARAMAAQRLGRPHEAVELLRPIVQDDKFSIMERVDWLPLLTMLASAVGDGKLAQRAAEAAHTDAVDEPITVKLQTDAWCHGLVTGDPDPLQKAIACFRQDDKKADLAFALEDAAVLYAARGDFERARTEVAEALSLYAELGASWDRRRAAARLRPLGVRLGVRGSRQRPRTGWESLSETERQVARLAAEGMSNPDIAAHLLLSRRTVQTHVSHILAKLNVGSRREIVRHAQEA